MSKEMKPEAALDFLRGEQEKAQDWRNRQASLGLLAIAVLRSRGELVFTKHGMWGGTEGLIGSANPGHLLTQATRPIAIDDFYISLRDKPEWPDSAVELLHLNSNDTESLRTAGDGSVLALPGARLVIPGVLSAKEWYEDAVEALVKTIGRELEPLEQEPRLPTIGHEGHSRKVINIRQNPEVLGEYLTRPLQLRVTA